MIVAKLTITTDDRGAKCLTGRTSYELGKGAILVLRKASESEWHLIAASGDGRRGETSPETARSFAFIPADEVTA